MYCANCGTQLVPGLSYCNRCGFNLRERNESNNGPVNAYLTAITIIGVLGLGMMLGGPIALRKEGGFEDSLIGIFMLLAFLIVSVTEFMLVRNLSRLTAPKESRTRSLPPPVQQDLRLPQASNLGEPVPSVTENTTRTLQYARREQ